MSGAGVNCARAMPSSPRIRVRQRRGRCFELAIKSQKRDPTWTLVHGYVPLVISGITTKGRVGHAWLECEGMIYDPVRDKMLAQPQPAYIPLHRYTLEEACKMMLAQHPPIYRPWEDDVPG